MARRPSLDKQIAALIEKFAPQIRDAFREAMEGVKSRVVLQSMIDAIRDGDLDRAFRTLGVSDAAMRPITAMIEQAFEQGGVTTAESFPRVVSEGAQGVFLFDMRNSRAEQWLREHSSTLVTRITEETRTAVRELMETGVREGRNPRNIALDIVGRVDPTTKERVGGVVGLTAPQRRALDRAREELNDLNSNYFTRERRDLRFDSIVRRAIKDGRALPQETIDKLVTRYSDSLLQLRGETIGRTEAIASLNRSNHEALRQLVETGAVRNEAIERIWDSAGDNRVRHTHRAMDGQTVVGVEDAFQTPWGARLLFPGDTSLGAPGDETIACRCRVRTKIDWLAEFDTPPLPAPPTPIVPPKPPEPQFAYESFVPLKTVAEAQAWMEGNVAKVVRFTKGMKIDGVNTIAHATQEVIERFGLEPLQFMGDPAQTGFRIGWTATNAAYADRIKAFLFKNKLADNKKLYDQEFPTNPVAKDIIDKRSAENLRLAKERVRNPEVRQLLDRMDDLRWSVSPDTRRTTYHEMGHYFHYSNKAELEAFIGGNPIMDGWAALVSKYSSTNLFEYVAESFTLYMNGDEDQFYRIHPRMLEYFRMKDKKNGTR